MAACCGAASTAAALLGLFAVRRQQSRRQRVSIEEPDGEAWYQKSTGLDGVLGTSMRNSLMSARNSVHGRRSLAKIRSARKSMDAAAAGEGGGGGSAGEGGRASQHRGKSLRQSFFSAISRFSDAPDADELEELVKIDEEQQKEKAKLLELRKRFEAEAADSRTARWLEDNDLLRYVRARAELDESEQLLRKALTWRCEQEKAWGVELAAGSFGSQFAKHQEDPMSAPDWWAFLDRHIHATIYGDDKFGVPITYVHFGNCDIQGCVREVGELALVKYMVYLTDHFIDRAREAYQEQVEDEGDEDAMPMHGGIVILDMDGLSWRHKGDIGAFKAPGEVTKFLHPERQRRSFIVRAPRIFSLCWKLISPMIDARAREKMQIIGCGDSMAPLLEELGEVLVPKCLGGVMADIPERPCGIIAAGVFAKFQQERQQQRD